MIYIAGPGHGGPALVGNTYLEGTYTEFYPNITEDEVGLKRLFKQFSFPGGIPSHVAPETPGSIHEGGELGYSLSHAFGAAFDNPDLIVACVIGDGEAETGPLATGWHSNKFLNAASDGAVLPILHLNGYKIANPTVLARIPHEELEQLLRGYGYLSLFCRGRRPAAHASAHGGNARQGGCRHPADSDQRAAKEIDRAALLADDRPQHAQGMDGPQIRRRSEDRRNLPCAPGSPLSPRTKPRAPPHPGKLDAELQAAGTLRQGGALRKDLAELAPKGDRRMGANPHANGGTLLPDLRLPPFTDYALDVPSPGSVNGEDTATLGKFLRDAVKQNQERRNFRIFGPDETASNRLTAILDATDKQWEAEVLPTDDHLALPAN